MHKRQLRMLILDAARAVLVARCNDSEVRRQIAALLGRLDHGLSDEQVSEQLKTLRAGRPSSKSRLNENRRAGRSVARLLSPFRIRSALER